MFWPYWSGRHSSPKCFSSQRNNLQRLHLSNTSLPTHQARAHNSNILTNENGCSRLTYHRPSQQLTSSSTLYDHSIAPWYRYQHMRGDPNSSRCQSFMHKSDTGRTFLTPTGLTNLTWTFLRQTTNPERTCVICFVPAGWPGRHPSPKCFSSQRNNLQRQRLHLSNTSSPAHQARAHNSNILTNERERVFQTHIPPSQPLTSSPTLYDHSIAPWCRYQHMRGDLNSACCQSFMHKSDTGRILLTPTTGLTNLTCR